MAFTFRRSRLGIVATATAASFGCVTLRVPVSTMAAEIPVADGQAEPQLELWVESNKALPPEQAASAAAEARAALASAMKDREAPGPDQLLVLRAQGVTRTADRRKDQGIATAGVVVGAVALVAVAVVALAGGRGGGGHGGGKPSLGGAGARPPLPGTAGHLGAVGTARPTASAGLLAARPPAPGWSSPLRPPPPGQPSWPHPGWRPEGRPHGSWTFYGSTDVEFGGWWWAPGPPPPGPWVEVASWEVMPAGPPVGGDGVGEPAPLAPLRSITLPPPPPWPVETRGFFEGDWLRLELTVVEGATGQALWRKTVEGDLDPRDAVAVRRLLDGALVADGWAPVE
jgi:hypothetical protein